MKIMIDTNVIISSLLKQGSLPDIVLNYVCNSHSLILCDHIINECYIVAKRRFPNMINVLDDLFAQMRYELVAAPSFPLQPEQHPSRLLLDESTQLQFDQDPEKMTASQAAFLQEFPLIRAGVLDLRKQFLPSGDNSRVFSGLDVSNIDWPWSPYSARMSSARCTHSAPWAIRWFVPSLWEEVTGPGVFVM